MIVIWPKFKLSSIIYHSMKFSELLKDRAERFLYYAEVQIKDGSYDISCFNSEQAVRLYIKGKILEISGELPRTHSLRDLLRYLGRIVGKVDRVFEFIKTRRAEIRMLESVYLESRYFPSIYEKEDAELLLKIAKEVIEFVRSIQD